MKRVINIAIPCGKIGKARLEPALSEVDWGAPIQGPQIMSALEILC